MKNSNTMKLTYAKPNIMTKCKRAFGPWLIQFQLSQAMTSVQAQQSEDLCYASLSLLPKRGQGITGVSEALGCNIPLLSKVVCPCSIIFVVLIVFVIQDFE